jgi:hypothetical protein
VRTERTLPGLLRMISTFSADSILHSASVLALMSEVAREWRRNKSPSRLPGNLGLFMEGKLSRFSVWLRLRHQRQKLAVPAMLRMPRVMPAPMPACCAVLMPGDVDGSWVARSSGGEVEVDVAATGDVIDSGMEVVTVGSRDGVVSESLIVIDWMSGVEIVSVLDDVDIIGVVSVLKEVGVARPTSGCVVEGPGKASAMIDGDRKRKSEGGVVVADDPGGITRGIANPIVEISCGATAFEVTAPASTVNS